MSGVPSSTLNSGREIFVIKSENHFRTLQGNKNPTVMVFSMGFCGPCMTLLQYMKNRRCAEAYSWVDFCYGDVDDIEDLADDEEIECIPYVIFYDSDGNRKLTQSGGDLEKFQRNLETLTGMTLEGAKTGAGGEDVSTSRCANVANTEHKMTRPTSVASGHSVDTTNSVLKV